VSGGERGSGRKGERVWEEVKEKGGKEIEKELKLGEFGVGHVAHGEMKRSGWWGQVCSGEIAGRFEKYR